MAVIKIKPEQVVAQWAILPHKFEVNCHNMEVSVSRELVKMFKQSFVDKRWDGQGWADWKPGFQGKNELLDETGTLQNSIKIKSHNKHKIVIHTDPGAFGSAARHKGYCYAAVHNNLNDIARKPTYGPTAQRQFMGESKDVDKMQEDHIHKIFIGLPVTRIFKI